MSNWYDQPSETTPAAPSAPMAEQSASMPPPPPPQQSAPRRRPGIVIVALLVGFAGGIGGAVVADQLNIGSSSTKASNSPVQMSEVDSSDPSIGDTVIAQVANVLADSVVTISSVIDDGAQSGEATGTGVVLTADGEILTNAHVIDGASKVRVRFAGETEPRPATVIASEVGNDLALLKIAATGLKPVTFAQPNTVRIGDTVVAIGYALALDGGPTVTSGIISALKRTIVTDAGALNGLIQTDAPISSGNSGGPLVNLRGEVVGINTAVARGDSNSAANNVGFSIGVEEVLRVVEQLRSQASGTTRKEGYLGVGLEGRTDGGQGAIITEVEKDSPADVAGIKVDDVVLSVNGEPITGQAGLVAAIRDRSPGDAVEIEILRAGSRVTVKATLVARPSE